MSKSNNDSANECNSSKFAPDCPSYIFYFTFPMLFLLFLPWISNKKPIKAAIIKNVGRIKSRMNLVAGEIRRFRAKTSVRPQRNIWYFFYVTARARADFRGNNSWRNGSEFSQCSLCCFQFASSCFPPLFFLYTWDVFIRWKGEKRGNERNLQSLISWQPREEKRRHRSKLYSLRLRNGNKVSL